MNLKYFFAGLAIAVPALLCAKPADPRVRTYTNPDGSTIEVRVHGDEYFNFMTDAECTRLLERDSRGFIVDAVRFGEVLRFNREDVEVLKAEVEEARMQDAALRQPARMAALTSEGRSQYPTIGEGNHSLVVLVEFDDVEFTMDDPQDYFHRQLNEPGFSDYGGKGSALDYYAAISNGKYLPTFDVVGPVKLSKKASYFYKNRENPIVNMPEFVREAMTLVDENFEVDFSNYDLDEDGVLDTVFFYYAGYGSADSDTQTIWPHQADFRWYSTLTLGGKRMGPYACGNELKGLNPETGRQPWRDGSAPWVDGIGTFAHEYGHVLGLPDLYDVNYSGTTVTPGDWDVMDAGCYNFDGCVPPLFSAYEQWVCHWLEFDTAEDKTHYDLPALGHSDAEPKAVRIRIPMNEAATNFYQEYFVIESRDNTGWDACFPEPGLMIWRIYYKKNNWTNNSVNTNGVSNVEIFYAKSNKHPLFQSGSIYPGADLELKPSGKYTYWRSPYITNIAYDEASMTGSFDYNMVEPTDKATVLHDNPEAAADGSKAFTLVWDEVEGVDEYLVTIETVKSGKIVNNFKKASVGNVTSVTVDGLSTMYWNLEMKAFVTCVVGGIQSTQDSNVIVFTPSALQKEGASVGSIEAADAVIAGGVGCIIAPEGAEVYNPAGQRLKTDGLAPGVYIVVYDNKSVKVMVR
ncbi:MAG: M6 family metalloprotease domain-containing protein [Muribaculaceae bacterium]|nr:M6 family metalloprotease domain-containing protein [Muribaculaceae bacterium]